MNEQIDMEESTPELLTKAVGVSDADADPAQRQLQMAEEFNVQRARMKELILQKEEQVNRVHQQKKELEEELLLVRQQRQQFEALSLNQHSEIQNLTLLVQEMVEAESSANNEARHLQARVLELEQQIAVLGKQKEQELSSAPSVLMQAVTKRIARKLGADPDKPDTLDDSMKKAQEDAELLRSLVVPLEEEIKALKEKLRDTDAQLHQATYNKCSKSAEGLDGRCDMCANYEAQLVTEQAKCAEERKLARHAQLALKMATEELEQAKTLHAETLTTLKSEWTATEEELTQLRCRVDSAENALESTQAAVAAADQHTLQRLTELTVQRETLQEQLNRLESENNTLAGKYSRMAEEMQLEEISLPEDPDELQLHALRLREELIVACVGRETAVASEEALRAELLGQVGVVRENKKRSQHLAKENQRLQEQAEVERNSAHVLNERIRAGDKRLQEAHADNSKLSDQIAELRARVSSLQNDLDNSEKVQQDFVRLSQSLQVELERIREDDTEVRWQHDEDINECTACHQHLPPNKKKMHCRHCGRIFCEPCLSHTVLSGPRKAPSHVCTVCHTLLEPNTRPYFSTEVLHT